MDAPGEGLHCKECGFAVSSAHRFCFNCGSPLKAVTTTSTSSNDKNKKDTEPSGTDDDASRKTVSAGTVANSLTLESLPDESAANSLQDFELTATPASTSSVGATASSINQSNVPTKEQLDSSRDNLATEGSEMNRKDMDIKDTSSGDITDVSAVGSDTRSKIMESDKTTGSSGTKTNKKELAAVKGDGKEARGSSEKASAVVGAKDKLMGPACAPSGSLVSGSRETSGSASLKEGPAPTYSAAVSGSKGPMFPAGSELSVVREPQYVPAAVKSDTSNSRTKLDSPSQSTKAAPAPAQPKSSTAGQSIKSEKPPVSQKPSVNASSAGAGATSGGNKTSTSTKVRVHFHVVVSTTEFQFKGNPRVVLCFQNKALGGFDDRSKIMTVVKKIDDKHFLLHIEEAINIEFLIDRTVDYKYAVLGKEGKAVWEFVYRKVSDGKANRLLRVPVEKTKGLTEWQQYDGIMVREPDTGFLQGIKDGLARLSGAYHKHYTEETKIAVRAMLPSWEMLADGKDSRRIETLLEKFDQVCQGVRSCFMTEDVRPDQNKIKEVMIEHIAVLIEMYQSGYLKDRPGQVGLRLASACCVVYLVKKHDLSLHDDKLRRTVFTMLAIQPPSKDTKSCEDYEQLVRVHFADERWRRLITDALTEFIKKSPTELYSLLAIPLFHFLTNQSVPNKPLSRDVKHRTDKFWGVVGISTFIDDFKVKNRDKISVDVVERHLLPLFRSDHMLPRTVLAVMSYSHIKDLFSKVKMPPDACLANVAFFTYVQSYAIRESLEAVFGRLRDIIGVWMKDHCLNSGKDTEELRDILLDTQMHHVLATDLLESTAQKFSYLMDQHLFVGCVEVVAAVISNQHDVVCALASRDPTKEAADAVTKENLPALQKEVEKNVIALFGHVKNWLNMALLSPIITSYSSYSPDIQVNWKREEITCYGRLITVFSKESALNEKWKELVARFILDRMERVDGRLRVYMFAYLDFTEFPQLEDCFSKAAFDVLENSSQTKYGDFSFVFDAANNNESARKIRSLLCRIFEKAWPTGHDGKEPDELTILKHILTWPSFTRFLNLFYGRSNIDVLLNEECLQCIAASMSVFQKAVEDTVSGSLTVQHLHLLVEHSRCFLDIFRIISASTDGDVPWVPRSGISGIDQILVVQKLINWRNVEIEEFYSKRALVQHFVDLCASIKSDELSGLRSKLNRNTDDLSIREICFPRAYTDQNSRLSYQPEIVYFGLKDNSKALLGPLHDRRESIIFKRIWNAAVRSLGDGEDRKSLTIDDVVQLVWMPADTKWRDLGSQITAGTITFADVVEHTGCFKKDYVRIENEIKLACANNDAIAKLRCRQIEQYHTLCDYSAGARQMLRLQEMFNMTGDFQQVAGIASLMSNMSLPLSYITEELVRSGQALHEITSEKVECLKVFLDNSKFADWLKASLKGPKEVKVLVDLAMISAQGLGDLEVQRVSCLHAAVLGYSPLIYDLTPDMGFDKFLPLCQAVWHALDADAALPKKFSDMARELEWLDRIKKSHASVEVNALSLAHAINERGIYTVGSIKTAAAGCKRALDEVIDVKFKLDENVPEMVETGAKYKVMDVLELNELNSRLMLVAGKKVERKEQVDRFVEVFEQITRLGTLYVEICNTGCTLFQDWKAVFHCSSHDKKDTCIKFGKDGKHILRGNFGKGSKDVVNDISDLCDFMEKCLENWRGEINAARNKWYYLNHFTTEQLVILQNELAKINSPTKTDVPRHVYHILSTIRNPCSVNDLRNSMQLAFGELADDERKRQQKTKKPPPASSVDRVEQQSARQLSAVNATVARLRELGFSLRLAQRAVAEKGADVDEACMWCAEHESEFDDAEDVDSDEEETSPADVSDNEDTYPSIEYSGLQLDVTKDSMTAGLFQRLSRKGTLRDRLTELWTSFQQEMIKSVADYLSLAHLGMFLKRLALIGSSKLDRPVPEFLKGNQPNLILCSQAEILRVVLSLYMHKHGSNLPLPGPDEVLVCHEHTSAEEVELLWRRAEGDASAKLHGKIFTLVHAEKLGYATSRDVEKTLETFTHRATDLRLAIVCCREMEGHCQLISALDRFRVKATPVDVQDIRAYLKDHFTVAVHSGSHGRLAAMVDAESCCVRVIKSHRAGVGKTLYIKRLIQQLDERISKSTRARPTLLTIPLHCRNVDQSAVLKAFLDHSKVVDESMPRIFHIDVAHEVVEGVDHLLFNLLVLGSITDRTGYVWTRRPEDLYVIEAMPLLQQDLSLASNKHSKRQQKLQYVHQMFDLLPFVTCWSPQDSLDIMRGKERGVAKKYTNAVVDKFDQKMDRLEFESSMFQLTYKCLRDCCCQRLKLRDITLEASGTEEECIETLLQHCRIVDPSWSELRHFVNFLNVQLLSCKESVFCSDYLSDDLPGFQNFVVQFMIQMSRDFATRSLVISEETPEQQLKHDDDELLELLCEEIAEKMEQNMDVDDMVNVYALERRWETSPHPYLFFNADWAGTFTFMGFIIDIRTGNILAPNRTEVLSEAAISRQLCDALIRNRVDLQENFDALERSQKILKMSYIMGIRDAYDPDDTYELTADNVKKMMAIYMRFRCNIPVIVMGETGCGKTRLVKFMCDLWKPPGADVTNMILVKVHGGTSRADIISRVRKAIVQARTNRDEYPDMQTVLFFDEANTTEEIGLIKEIMCDQTIGGKPIETHHLKIIAACNPYRKHSAEMINKLEHAGLGYHVKANQTVDRFGRIPMRQLVYRVQPLPQSMLPLVWDFGQLGTEVESLYINKMVARYGKDMNGLESVPALTAIATKVLTASQEFMRLQKDECSFVSLRDVDRALQVMVWFYNQQKILQQIDDQSQTEQQQQQQQPVVEETVAETDDDKVVERFKKALILAIGVCYHSCLEKRQEYREFVAPRFTQPCALEDGANTLLEYISRCQDVFLNEIELGPNIARNQALKENVFMMVVCIELRIPLFLVGKPGSSKSLAKTIVADAMQGSAAGSELFKSLKSVHMVSYQCSPLSTPEGIVGTFRQCARLQEKHDLNKFVSVVVLDEVGLAEDSPRMPLKALHPLLEDGCEGDEEPQPYMKVGFIGISNWALDPAKMNRGILVQRGVPDEEELVQSALGICGTNEIIKDHIKPLVKPMAQAYLQLYNSALEIREFFGLRDFYSLIKMVCGFAKTRQPTWHELQHAILRNFGGLETVEPVKVFGHFIRNVNKRQARRKEDPPCDPASLIRASLFSEQKSADKDSESRYLLILTENYAALGILQQELLNIKDAIIIFGSSFPKDQQYIQVCRNINRIKVCMETGQTVVLLNLENLYESLYDALNQYYTRLGDQRFVDLGLGTQRLKCRVHDDFRLIVVAEKKVVMEKFPIPLINRLEKHFLAMETMLTPEQRNLAHRLDRWAKDFCGEKSKRDDARRNERRQPEVGDVFIGYRDDTAASIILQVCHSNRNVDEEPDPKTDGNMILNRAQEILLRCATPESIANLENTPLASQYDRVYKTYFQEQCHDSFFDFVKWKFVDEKPLARSLFVQITTRSQLLHDRDRSDIARVVGVDREDVIIESLQKFDLEQQFCKALKDAFNNVQLPGKSRLMIVQCDSGDDHADLIACARFNITNEFNQSPLSKLAARPSVGLVHVVFIIQLHGIADGSFAGFQGGQWTCYHIDELHLSDDKLPSMAILKTRSIHALIDEAVKQNSGSCHNRPVVSEEDNEINVTTAERHDAGENRKERFVAAPPVDDFGKDVDAAASSSGNDGALLSDRKRQVREGLQLSYNVIAGDSGKTGFGSDFLDVDGLIRKCIHSAAVRVQDAPECRHRKADRLNILVRLMSEPADGQLKLGCSRFMNVIRSRILYLLRDKEQSVTSLTIANKWLSKEAASFQAVSQHGSYKNAVWRYLESCIEPLLASIIAMADINMNLDLLGQAINDQSLLWQFDIWIELLADDSITVLKYRDLQSAVRKTELPEFEVKLAGPSDFKLQMPFSFAVRDRVASLIHAAKQKAGDELSICAQVENLIDSTSLGEILQRACQLAGHDVVIGRYLHDFVRMTYKSVMADPGEEFQLVENDVVFQANRFIATRQNAAAGTDDDADDRSAACSDRITIPIIHLVYDVIRGRLGLFSQLAQTSPDCVKTLAGSNKTYSMPLDLSCLLLLMEKLTPASKTELDVISTRTAWSNRVRSLTPVIEGLLVSVSSDSSPQFNAHRKKCRHTWDRICAVQLFIQHVCPAGLKDELGVQKCPLLWNNLGDETDFKSDATLKKVEFFLKTCNNAASEAFFGKNQCPYCKNAIEKPVRLPCKHRLCFKCVTELKEINDLNCPAVNCNKGFPADFEPRVDADKKSVDEFTRYKQRCNAFFMDLVARLCFTNSSAVCLPPERAAVERLMKYVTCESKLVKDKKQSTKTKTMTIFDDALDPTPVVRSFLLQLLLRSDIGNVREYLHDFFNRSRELIQSHTEHIRDLCLLFVDCLEDHFHTQSVQSGNELDQLKYAKECLESARQLFADSDKNAITVDILEAVAKARCGLSFSAVWLYRVHIRRDVEDYFIGEARRLSSAAQTTCDVIGTDHPRLHLMRHMVRRYGMEALKQIWKCSETQWMIPTGLQEKQAEARPDRFIVCGDAYVKLRNALAEVLVSGNVDNLATALEETTVVNGFVEEDFYLAVQREFTCSLDSQNQSVPNEVAKKLDEFCQKNERLKRKTIVGQLLQSALPRGPKITAPETIDSRSLSEAVVHFKVVLTGVQNVKLFGPLVAFVNNPQTMTNSYLPTMPQDVLDEFRQAVLQAGAGTQFYQCPLGHPYVVGECGQPMQQVVCRCGHPIGGTDHTPAAGNTVLTRADNTKMGHILGVPQRREPAPDRGLTAASVAILRLFLHMSMYLGAAERPQEVDSLVDPPVGDVSNFLWQHMAYDIDTIKSAISRSVDDVFLLVHLILGQVSRVKLIEDYHGDIRLSTKESRQQWENGFVNVYVAPMLKVLDKELQRATNTMLNDDRLANNALLKLLYEVEDGMQQQVAPATSSQQVVVDPAMWRYRSQVSCEHLQQMLAVKKEHSQQNKKDKGQHQLLDLFINKVCHLQALRLLPNVLRLHRLLLARCCGTVDAVEAAMLKFDQFIDKIPEEIERDECERLFKDFTVAWNTVHLSLADYIVDRDGRLKVDVEYAQQEITTASKTPLAMLLPHPRDQGVCSIALVHFLCQVQNEFLEQYAQLSKTRLENIKLFDASVAHLIAFHAEHDLQSIILANCNYSLELGKGTHIDYDFEMMERQIEERFIRGRPRLDYQVECMRFREELSNSVLFSELRAKISQEPLSNSSEIETALQNQLPVVNSLLADLNIAVGFLVSVSEAPDTLLVAFMKNKLKMKLHKQLPETISQCRLKHVESLWLSLSFLRACLMVNHKRDPFDNMPDKFHEDIPVESKSVTVAFERIELNSFLRFLHECILFKIAVLDTDENANCISWKLKDVLYEYVQEKDAEVPGLMEHLPAELLVKHCIKVWRQALRYHRQISKR